MKRVLIVSPHFPPVNAADCHRVRMYLPYFRENGWEPVVLAVDPKYVEAPQDELLLAGLPQDVDIHLTKAWPVELTRLWGSRTIGRRCYRFIKRAGDALLAKGGFDLVFFSTTAFSVFRLGPKWLKRFGVPFVIDLQDPWISPHYQRNPEERPPGGRLRYWLASRSAKRWEPVVARTATGVVTVSPAYRDDWVTRHGLAVDDFLPLSFGGSRSDYGILRSESVKQGIFRPAEGMIDVVYVGRGGTDLAAAFTGLFRAFGEFRERNPETARRFRFHFVGTSYADRERRQATIEPLAKALGVGDQVREHPGRIPYFQALRCLKDAAGLVVPTSSDDGYNPSKIANYLLAGKPLLIIGSKEIALASGAHAESGVPVIPADDGPGLKDWLESLVAGSAVPPARRVDEYDAEKLCGKMCRFFDRRLEGKSAAEHPPGGTGIQ